MPPRRGRPASGSYARHVEYGTGPRRGTVEIKVPEYVYKRHVARLLCRAHHPLALHIGTMEPGQPCGWHCQMTSPTAGTFPG